jgi:hypothetical protein
MSLIDIQRGMFARSKPDALRPPDQQQTAPRVPRAYRMLALVVMALCTLAASAMFCMSVVACGLLFDSAMVRVAGVIVLCGVLGGFATALVARRLYSATHAGGKWLKWLMVIAAPAAIIGGMEPPAAAVHNATIRCNQGDPRACMDLAHAQRDGLAGLRRDPTAVERTIARACAFDPFIRECPPNVHRRLTPSPRGW